MSVLGHFQVNGFSAYCGSCFPASLPRMPIIFDQMVNIVNFAINMLHSFLLLINLELWSETQFSYLESFESFEN